MDTNGNVTTKVKSYRLFFIGFGIASALACCAIIVVLAISGLLPKLSAASNSPSINNEKPPHYGVFIKQNNGLMELQEQQIFSIPIEREMSNAQSISDSQPTIVIWRNNIDLDNLALVRLNQYLGQPKNEIRYNATPKTDGIIAVIPTSTLTDGIYCLIQGDPLAATLPGWCFRIGSISQNQVPTTTVVTLTQSPIIVKATETLSPDIIAMGQKCHAFENAKEQDKTIECYKNFTETYPNFFYAWDNLARVYGNKGEFQNALDASLKSLNVASTPEDKVAAYTTIGVDYYNLGEYPMAVKYLEEGASINIDPASGSGYRGTLLVWLSRSYEANGQHEEACKSWKETLEFARSTNYGWAIDWANNGLTKCP